MSEEAKRRDYTVTERAGPRVAGRHAVPGAVLSLTEDEAEYELREGTIALKGKMPTKAFERSPTADKLRAAAAGADPQVPAPGGSPAATS